MVGMGERRPVRITITLEGELDPTTVKAEAFSFALASTPDGADDDRREMTERAAAHLAGSLRASAQVLVLASGIGSLLGEWLPSFEADEVSFDVTVDAPNLGPEDGGQHLVRRGE